MTRTVWWNRWRPWSAVAVVLLAVAALTTVGWQGKRAEYRQALVDSERMDVAMMQMRASLRRVEAERAAMAPEDRGHGPGGARSEHERWFFEGPTAASAALGLMSVADQAGFTRLSYTGSETSVEGEFPPNGDLPVRRPVRVVQWPVRFEMEASYQQSLEFMERLATSQPAFALSALRLDVAMDDRGEMLDRLVLSGQVASHWFETGSGSDVE